MINLSQKRTGQGKNQSVATTEGSEGVLLLLLLFLQQRTTVAAEIQVSNLIWGALPGQHKIFHVPTACVDLSHACGNKIT